MLTDPLDALLASPNKVRVLRTMIGLAVPLSGRQIARLAGTSRKAQQALHDLTGLGIISRQDATGQHLYSYNRGNSLAGPLEALFEAEAARTKDLLRDLVKVTGSKEEVFAAAIFGSNAREAARPDSDLDVLVVVRTEKSVSNVRGRLLDAAPALFKRYGIRVAPIVMTRKRWRLQRQDPKSFASAVAGEARVFIGDPFSDAA